MTEIVAWLVEIERQAAEMYASAATCFAADSRLSAFMRQLAGEEEWHGQLLNSLSPGPGGVAGVEELMVIDEKTRTNISGLFAAGLGKLAAGEMSRQELLETMAAAEFSEWNDIFLYALHILQANNREYNAAVVEMERHKEQIIHFLATEPGSERLLEAMWRLPAVADKRILIVEKHPALARFLRNIVAAVGAVELVENADEGLIRLENENFDVVISDIDVLAMSSLEFYTRAIGRNPALKDRFIFYVGDSLHENRQPLASQEITVLSKPELISQLRLTVAGIAHKSRILH